jgi:hypothetical protein
VDADPTDEELRAFIDAMLSNLDRRLREPEVLDEAIRDHRDTWVMLYRASLRFDARRTVVARAWTALPWR